MDRSAAAPATGLQCSGQVLLSWRRQQLALGGHASELDWLLEMAAGIGWQQLQRLQLSPEQAVALRSPLQEVEALWRRHRQGHEPLQYLVGRCPWRDLTLHVAPGVLIPRQETELLVELALERCGTPPLWADLGTGSGCLAVALARAWPTSRGLAVDRSPEALAQARANLQAHGLLDRVQLLEGDWWSPLREYWGQLALVVSNPPYIPTAVWQGLNPLVRDHEPELALHGGADGLEALRAISATAAAALAPGGWLLLEHHHDQSAAVLALLQAAGLRGGKALPDLEGRLRFAAAQR